jgi:G3E family GTPase
MKVIILSGFLGSGKTSVLLQFAKRMAAKHPENPHSVAIIENEIGDIGVDDQTLGGSGGYEVKTLFAGCICCTLIGEVATSIMEIQKEQDPDYIIIEPSGVAQPDYIAETIKNILDLDSVITTIVDVQRWPRIACAMGTLLSAQLRSASLILVNKVDKVDKAALDECIEQVRGYNPTAPLRCIQANDEIAPEILDAIGGEAELDA